jgi:hypothetical protein
MKKGEEVILKEDYDLFGHNASDYYGVYISTSKETKKCLVYFPELEEWGEILRKNLKRVEPGVVSEEARQFVKSVKRMKYTV